MSDLLKHKIIIRQLHGIEANIAELERQTAYYARTVAAGNVPRLMRACHRCGDAIGDQRCRRCDPIKPQRRNRRRYRG